MAVTPSAASGTTIQDLVYTLDLSDNITAITDGLTSARNQTFGYDDGNRLTSASGLYGLLGYSYDEVGNRIGETSGSPALTLNYPSSSNRLDNITDGSNTRSFTYLASGHISEDVRTPSTAYEYTYNNAGRLTSVGLNSSPVATYLYNADGQRAQKTVSSTVTQFVYDLDGHLLVEADSSGNPIREYIWLDDMPVALVDSSSTPAIYYIQTDHLGRPQKMTDGSRNIVWDGVFDPFGKVTSISGAATNLLMFPGQYHDSESQLSQNWYRDYDPSIGRYVESDPIGLSGGINTYAYVEGNPVSRIDPKGLQSIPVPVPVPLPLPPDVFPGTPENDRITNWIMNHLQAIGEAASSAKSDEICSEDDCTILVQRINKKVSELKKRYADLQADKLNLPAEGKMSIAGHIQQFKNQQVNLRGLLNTADSNNCVGYTPDAWKWATKLPPSEW